MKRFISFILFLFSLCNTSYSQVFTDSNLPIVIINTDGGVAIPDDPRVLATMKIIYKGEGSRNYLTDQNDPAYLNYNGRINIEIRGSSSQAVLKKQYGFSTKKADNITNNNVSLLGLPKDNDWILYAMAFDASLIRNYLSYNLSRMIGEYASRTIFCEVVINGSYNGLYVLLEKIKSGTDRVDVYEIGAGDITFPGVTGGYITKADKTTGGDPIAWEMSSYLGINDVDFIHELPKPENVKYEQNNYIQSEFEKLRISAATGDLSLETGYPSVIDIPSFVDYMIINELAANADAYQFSTYYHKDRNGKLRAGPIWDLDLTYGNDLFMWGFDRSKTNTWQFSNGDNEGPRFWRDLFNNQVFRCYLSKKWNQLIQPGQPLNISGIESFIDQSVINISEAVMRENQRWGTVSNHANEILKIKTFLQQRITWMTSGLGSYSGCSNIETPPLVITKIMYNPAESTNFPNSKDLEFIEITNTGNKTENLTGVYFGGTGFVYQFPVNTLIEAGATIILAGNATIFRVKYGFFPAGQFTRNLSNTGENLLLLDGFGNIIDNVHYSNLPPWPNADGNGYYLELVDPFSDNSLPTNWIAYSGAIVSVEDTWKNEIPRLYPSPVRDNLHIEMQWRIISLQLLDFQGRLLRVIPVDSESYSLDMSAYSPGLYLIKINTAERSFVRKVIKE
ncbi:MAG TPA: CotH kinase family protein [Bacteroidales bacterium]|nr:CotH kinase family protein [Bacteroidales bacterium]